MGHNVSKKNVKITEINSISIRQSLANGDVEIDDHGTLSGNPDMKKSKWRSDLGKSIRRSFKPIVTSRGRPSSLPVNGSLHSDKTHHDIIIDEPDFVSTPVKTAQTISRPKQDTVTREQLTRKSTRGRKNGPYRSDSVLSMVDPKPNLTERNNSSKQNGNKFGDIRNKNSEPPATRVVALTKSDVSEEFIEEIDSEGKEGGFQRFEKQRSTTRRRSRKSSTEVPSKQLSGAKNGKDKMANGRIDFDNEGEIDNGDAIIDSKKESPFVSARQLYNILNDGGPEALREIDKNHVLLLDSRKLDDFENTHIIGAKQISPTQSNFGADLSNQFKSTIVYDEDGQSHFSSRSTLTMTLDRLSYLGHKAKILQGGFQNFLSQYPYMCQTDDKFLPCSSTHYPSEVLPHRLYLSSVKQVTNGSVLSDMDIGYILNIDSKMIKPLTGNERVMNIQFREDSKNDLLQVMPQVISVISSALDNKASKVIVTCPTGNGKSAAVIALYLMYQKKWTTEKVVKNLKACRSSIHFSNGLMQQLQRCEELISTAY